ncbi:MAG: response regulator [Candidatus Omnitrophica bacterium]|nr:response regulator [Candidatus Omnitrophota bacterium]MBU2250928.1 response regulator [Candidatus Omnitrophota bacterium]MBU2474005.1 response regulator [Candidatus Omnitrophota bacterium]
MPKSILIIEDEQLITKSLSRLLKKEGYNVAITNSGREALEKIRNEDFDLIVSDIRMPDLDGIETIKEIRKYLAGCQKPAVPEVLITGYADEEKYQQALELKVADYIYKPFDISDFLEAVKRNLDVK